MIRTLFKCGQGLEPCDSEDIGRDRAAGLQFLAPGGAASDQERKRKRVTVHISQCIHPRAQNLKGLSREGVSSTTRKALTACSEAAGRRRLVAQAHGAGRVRRVSRGAWRVARSSGGAEGPWGRGERRGPAADADTEPQIKCSCGAPTLPTRHPPTSSTTTT